MRSQVAFLALILVPAFYANDRLAAAAGGSPAIAMQFPIPSVRPAPAAGPQTILFFHAPRQVDSEMPVYVKNTVSAMPIRTPKGDILRRRPGTLVPDGTYKAGDLVGDPIGVLGQCTKPGAGALIKGAIGPLKSCIGMPVLKAVRSAKAADAPNDTQRQ